MLEEFLLNEQSQAVTPLLAEDLSGTTSLENKLQIRGRSLMSSLSYSSRSRRKSMLKKSILVDVRRSDTVDVAHITKRVSSLNETVHELR